MKYQNPILVCDYSDPDVICVGDTFYMTASSFNFMPGLPILTSKDLVNWKLVNYACKRIPFDLYDKPQNAKGLWAPSIRFHDGMFYIFVATPDEGIFYTTAKDPLGNWSELKCVVSGKGFEDPCPIWDDGRLFIVHAFVKSRIGFNSKLALFEVDVNTMTQISGDKIIFDGSKTQPTIEGPKFYKRNGFYYIFAPAGGVSAGWQTVLRSKQIFGPYEEKILLVQGETPINGPHQGGWIETEKNNSQGIKDWFIHFQERGIFGRIVHLQPMKWVNDWPLMGTSIESGVTPGEPYMEFEKPFGFYSYETEHSNPLLDFQFSANPKSDYAEIHGNSIKLKVYSAIQNKEPNIWKSPNVLTKKIDAENFDFECEIDYKHLKENSCAGVVFLGDEYKALAIGKEKGKVYFSFIESAGSENGDEERFENIRMYPYKGSVGIVKYNISFRKINDRTAHVTLSFDVDDGIEIKTKPFIIENAHWVGGRFGFYAFATGPTENSYVTVSSIKSSEV